MESIKHVIFTVNSSFAIRDLLLIIFMSASAGFFIYFAYNFSNRIRSDKYLSVSLISYAPLFACLSYTLKVYNSIMSLLLAISAIVYMCLGAYKRVSINQLGQLFLVWSAISGIICGEGDFIVVAVLCIVISIILFVFRVIDDDMSRLLVIDGSDINVIEIQALIFKHFNRKAKLLTDNTDKNGSLNLTYRVSNMALNKLRNERINITELIENVDGVKSAVIVKEEASEK